MLDYYPEGPKLMVNGTFDGMSSPATVAHLHRATKGPEEPGGPTPGPKAFDLDVSEAANGTLNGSFWITEEQAEELRQGGTTYRSTRKPTRPGPCAAGSCRGCCTIPTTRLEDRCP